MKRRITAIILCLVMAAMLLPASALADWNQDLEIDLGDYEQYVPYGGSITLTAEVPDYDPSELSYQWRINYEDVAGATGSSYTLRNVKEPVEVSVRVTDQNGNYNTEYCYVRVDNELTVSPDYGAYYVEEGGSKTLTVTVSAKDTTGLSYQWSHYEHDPEYDNYTFVDIEGATGSSYTITNVTQREEYYCSVRDRFGNYASAYFQVSVDNGLTVEPDRSQTINVDPNSEYTMTVSASAKNMDGLSYQWYHYELYTYEHGSYYTYVKLPDAASNSWTAAIGAKSERYYCEVTDKFSNRETVSFELSIDNALTVSPSNSVTYLVDYGGSKTLTVTASAKDMTSLTYQWSGPSGPIENATGDSYTVSNVTGSVSYDCTVTDRYDNTKNVWFTVSVDNKLTAEAVQSELYAPLHGSTTMQVAASAADTEGLKYEWRSSSNGSLLPGAMGSSCTVSDVTGSGEYYCMVTDKYGNSQYVWFYVYVDNKLKVYAVSETEVYLNVGGSVTLTGTATATETDGLQYQWYERVYDSQQGYYRLQRIEGATSESYRVENLQRARSFYLQVTDKYGTTRSLTFTVGIENALEVRSGNDYFIKVPMNGRATLSVEVSATEMDGMTYLWRRQVYNDSEHWSDEIVPGAVGATLTTEAITMAVDYTCEVTDKYGNSGEVYFTVGPENHLTVRYGSGTEYQNYDVPYGGSRTISVAVSADDMEGLTYSWSIYTYDEANGYYNIVTLPGENGLSLTVTNVTECVEYQFKATDKYGNTATTSIFVGPDNGFSVTAPNGTRFTTSADGKVTLSVSVSANDMAGMRYEWKEMIPLSNNSYRSKEIPGANGPTYEAGPGIYQVTVWDKFKNEEYLWFYVTAETVDSGVCGDALTWTLDSEGTLTISGTGAMASYSYSATAPWSSVRTNVKSIVIGPDVTSIGNFAFYACSSLTSVTIPDGVTSIGNYAFDSCSSLTGVTIPDSVTSIGVEAFYGCFRLTNVAIPESVTSIGAEAFRGCSSLTNVAIPESVTSIGVGAFASCSSLQTISVAETNSAFRSVDGVLFSKSGKKLVAYPASKSDSVYAIPDGVTSIGDYAFHNCANLTAVTIPDGVTGIGDYTFAYCENLADLTIPDSVTSIGDYAFRSCENLAGVNIPDSVTLIGVYAFYDCTSLTSVTIPDGVTSIGNDVFLGCSRLTSVTIPDSVTSIGDAAFRNCGSLTSVTIPDGVTSIGVGAFYYCNRLTSVTIPDSVTSIGNNAFYECSAMTDVYYAGSQAQWNQIRIGSGNNYLLNAALHCSGGSGAETVASGVCGDNLTWTLDSEGTLTISGTGVMASYEYDSPAPWDTDVKSVVIGTGVTSIGDRAFYGCASLTGVTIPDGVTSIGVEAFFDCCSLAAVTIPDSVTSIGDYAFRSCENLAGVNIPDSVTLIGVYAFYDCTSLTSVTIPDGVTSIGNDAFAYCENLASVTIPVSVTSIGDGAFYSCTNLTDVYYGGSKAQWSQIQFGSGNDYLLNAALHCSGGSGAETVASGVCGDNLTWTLDSEGTLTISGTGVMASYEYDSPAPWDTDVKSVVIGTGVTSIGDFAFYACSSLASVTIPDSVTSIGNDAFRSCENLAGVNIPDSVTLIGDYAFYACSSLTSVTIPDGVTSIGNDAFGECRRLTGVNIPNGVTTIGNDVFSGCRRLTGVTIPDGVTSIGNAAFAYCENLASVTIPVSVTSIEDAAFYSCTNLTDVYYDGSEEEWSQIQIGSWNDDLLNAELHCSGGSGAETVASGVCGDDLTWTLDSIGTLTISGTGEMASYSSSSSAPWYSRRTDVKSIVIGQGVTSIGNWAFDGARLTSVTIPDSVTNIGDHAFFDCGSLTSVIIPDGVTNIGDGTFCWCDNLTSVTIPDGVTTIGDSAFYFCVSLTGITIPDGVTTIGDEAFAFCKNLTGVTIPGSVTDIGNGAFIVCDRLQAISAAETNPAYLSVDGVLFSKDGKTLAAYPAGKSDSFYVIPEDVTCIGDYAFYGCNNLTAMTIPDGVTTIGGSAFSVCENLTSVTILDGVTTIGGSAFSACENLTSVTIPDSVSSIGVMAFMDCSSLTSVTIPDGVTTIRDGMFYGCDRLANVAIPDSVTSIEDHAFLGCASLTSVTIPDGVTTIGFSAFLGCAALTDVHYGGSQAEWSQIQIGSENDDLLNAAIYCSDGGIGPVQESYTLIYNANGGVGAPNAQVIIQGRTLTLSAAVPTRKGYTFLGWAESSFAAAAQYRPGASFTKDADVTLYAVWQTSPVTITRQPVSVTANSGDYASFSIEATGDNLCYQWQYWNGSGWTNTGDDWNSSADTLSFRTWNEGDGLRFRCVVWNDEDGADLAFSDAATLTVTPAKPVTITKQPVSVSAKSGDYVSYSVEATGDNLCYQWQYWNGSGWANTGDDWNSSSATMTFQTWDGGNGLCFRCVVWNALNDAAYAFSDTVGLTVIPTNPVTITRQPKSVTAESGTFAEYTVKAKGNNLRYQWQYWNGSDWANTGDDWYSSTDTMSFQTWPEGSGLSFRCVVWNGENGADWAVSDTVSLTITPSTAVMITRQPVSVTARDGSYVSYSVEAAGKNLRYQWQYWNGEGWANTGDDWNSSTSTMSFQTWPGGNGLYFRCVVWNGENGADWAASDTVSLTVTPSTAVTVTRQPVSVSARDSSYVSYSVEATGENLCYQWQYWNGSDWANTGDDWYSSTDTMSFQTWYGGSGLSFRCVVWNGENGADWTVSDTVTLTVY